MFDLDFTPIRRKMMLGAGAAAASTPEIRKDFPEMWMFDLLSDSG